MSDRTTVRPVFVLGCPRSGTTVTGTYVGSASRVHDMGEYAGFYLAVHHVPHHIGRAPSPMRDPYQRSIESHAAAFAAERVREAGCDHYVDSTPWNLLIHRQIAQLATEPLFVLCLRSYRGVVQSLQRSFAQGFEFAGGTPVLSAELWARFNLHALTLPTSRTITVNYDRLCAGAEAELDELDRQLDRHGVPACGRTRAAFIESHAVPAGQQRPTVARLDDEGSVRFTRRPSFDADRWSEEMELAVGPIVNEVHRKLTDRFGNRYAA